MQKEKIIIANWKMQLSLEETSDLVSKVKAKFAKFKKGEVVICPNFMSLTDAQGQLKGSDIKLGAQDVFWEEKGAYTGEISSTMLKEAGCEYVIIGHSERRKHLRENYEYINKKVKAVINAGDMTPVICIGESWDERKTERRDFVLTEQLQLAMAGIDFMGGQQIVIAYEPIWAIGSGTAIEPTEAEYAHKIIRLTLNQMFGMKIISDHFRVVYGGSISSKNVKEFINLSEIDGLLVGGASLNAEEFYRVANTIIK